MIKKGPQTSLGQEIHQTKYRETGEDFEASCYRVSSTLSDNDEHRHNFSDALLNMRFLPAGRVQAAIGSPRKITPYNCFVSGVIADDFDDIMKKATEAGHTLRLGGGIGYDFSTLRPRGSLIKSLGSQSSGPVSFMDIYDSICGTISSAGHRRGAQMGVLRVDHPDIEEFIHAKQNSTRLTRFNVSVGVTDPFMEAVKNGTDFNLKFRGRIISTVDARTLWDSIMRSTWNWAEPGVLFIDRINEFNNLWYCETLTTCNPCQPGFATVLTPDGLVTFDDIDVGSVIWSGKQWTTVTNKVSTGVKSVSEYVTNAGIFTGTENHRVVEGGVKIEVKDAKGIDLNTGPDNGAYVLNAQDVVDGWVLGDGAVHKASGNLVYLNLGVKDGQFHKEFPEFVVADRTRAFKYGWEVQTTITADDLPKTYERRVPDHFLFAKPERVAGFLRGLYSANGSVCGGRVTLKAASKTLIEDVQIMLSSLGISSYVTTNKSKLVEFDNGEYVCKQSYDLNIRKDISVFQNTIGFVHDYKNRKLNGSLKKQSNKRKTTFEIVEKRKLGNCEVFDITVDAPEHTYWTGGVLVSNCGEQPLPPYGACLLGSFNLVKYVSKSHGFNYELFRNDVQTVVRAMDNIIDQAIYPLPQQEEEAKSKRRMGLGVTGVANALEYLGYEYGSEGFLRTLSGILADLRDITYQTSSELAREKGAFPLFDKDKYLKGKFVETLPTRIKESISKYGIRNSHLLSIAPTGTISLAADNISSGIEPVFTHEYSRVIQTFNGPKTEEVQDFGYREWGLRGRTADSISVGDHVKVLTTAQRFVDSSVSKTCNVGPEITWDEFKGAYLQAFDGGAKGCTTFRSAGKRMGILKETPPEEFVGDEDDLVCRIDPVTGAPTCS